MIYTGLKKWGEKIKIKENGEAEKLHAEETIGEEGKRCPFCNVEGVHTRQDCQKNTKGF